MCGDSQTKYVDMMCDSWTCYSITMGISDITILGTFFWQLSSTDNPKFRNWIYLSSSRFIIDTIISDTFHVYKHCEWLPGESVQTCVIILPIFKRLHLPSCYDGLLFIQVWLFGTAINTFQRGQTTLCVNWFYSSITWHSQSVFQLIPKVLDRVEVRALSRPVRFLHTKMGQSHKVGGTLLSNLWAYAGVLKLTFIEIKGPSPNNSILCLFGQGHVIYCCLQAEHTRFNFVTGSQAHNMLPCSLLKMVNDLLLIAFPCHVHEWETSRN